MVAKNPNWWLLNGKVWKGIFEKPKEIQFFH